MKRYIWKYAIAGILLTGCKTPSISPFKGGECRTETSAALDSTYHYVRDSVVVYVGEMMNDELGMMNDKPDIERWHTEWRERVVVRTDTVYRDREVVVQLPPERYVPRAVKGLAWTGAAAIMLLLLWVVWRICRR